MNRLLIVLFAICTLAAAMVPRHTRAFNADEKEFKKPASENQFCAPQTPCAWSIYQPKIKRIEMNITNTYCSCAPGQVCDTDEDDATANAIVHRCRRVEVDALETPES